MKKGVLLSFSISFVLASSLQTTNLNINFSKSKQTSEFNKIGLSPLKIQNFVKKVTQNKVKFNSSKLIIEFKTDNIFELRNILSTMGMNPDSLKVLNHIKTKGSIGILKLSPNQNISYVIKNLKKNPLIKSVSFDYVRKPQYIPNDTLFNQEWHLDGNGGEKDINIKGVWDNYKGDKKNIVAVFDTGESLHHEDLEKNLWVNEKELNGKPGVDDDGDGYVDDIYGYDFAHDLNGDNSPLYGDIGSHGTHVSGIIGGVGDNDIGISGVNLNATILPVKVFRPSMGAYDSDILEAVDYVLKLKSMGYNIVAINASYGGFGGDATDSPMRDAIKKLGDNGIVFFAAAGNSGVDNDEIFYDEPALPASYDLDNIVAVAANDENGELTSFSQYGKKTVQVSAPGINILSTTDFIDGNETDDNIALDDFDGNDNINFSQNSGGNWTVVDTNYHSPTHSVTDSPDGNYNDYNSTFILSDDINLSSYKDKPIAIDYCMDNKLANGDYLIVYFYDKNSGDYNMMKYYGATDGWKCAGIPIPEYYKTDSFRVAFLLYPNGDGQSDDGVYLDDIKVGDYNHTNTYEKWAGTSMATPVVTGTYALMTQALPNESMYGKISRIIGNGDKLIDNITGVNLNVGDAINNPAKPFIFNTKTVKTVDKTLTFSVYNAGDNPVVYVGDEKAKIISNNDGNITIELPDEAKNYITVQNGDLNSSNRLYISKWKMLTKIPQLGSYNPHMFGVNALYDNKIYSFEGVSGDVDIYDIKNDEWNKISDSESSPVLYSTSQQINGKVYMFGGKDSDGYVDNVRVYDIKADSFTNASALPMHFEYARSAVLGKDIYILGGFDENNNTLKSVYKYDTLNNTFTKTADLPETLAYFEVCAFGNKIYMFGGMDSNGEYSDKAYVYDPAANKWSGIKNIPQKVAIPACVNIDNKFLALFSGMDENRFIQNVYRYYPDSNSYDELNDSVFDNILPRGTIGNNILSDGEKIYYVGGYNPYVGETSTIEEINVSAFEKVQQIDTNETNSTENNDTNDSSGDDNGGGGSAGAFDIFMLITLLGGSLLIFRRKQ